VFSIRNWIPVASAIAPHRAAERVDLAHDLALAEAADRGIAAHLADAIVAQRDEHRPRPRRAAASAASIPACPRRRRRRRGRARARARVRVGGGHRTAVIERRRSGGVGGSR
jgi:hypothetical protein